MKVQKSLSTKGEELEETKEKENTRKIKIQSQRVKGQEIEEVAKKKVDQIPQKDRSSKLEKFYR